MFSINFWRQAIERAVKTGAQTLIIVLGADQANLLAVDWVGTLTMVGSGMLLSVLTSIVTSGIGESDSPSAVVIESAPPEPEL